MRASLLHDIGELGISNRILDKSSRLTDQEFARVRRPLRLTYEILSRVAPFRGMHRPPPTTTRGSTARGTTAG